MESKEDKPVETTETRTERIESQYEKVRAENDRTEKLAKELREIKNGLEQLRTEKILSGTTQAGQAVAPQKTEAEIKKEKALEFWKGSTIADSIKRNG